MGYRLRQSLAFVVSFVLLISLSLFFALPAQAASWGAVTQPGFGSSNNIGVYSLAEFNGSLYAGTRSLAGGCQVYRSQNGTAWSQVNVSGFGNANNGSAWCMTTFQNRLYVGTYNETNGSQVWSTADGTTWAPSNADGFGSTANKGIYSLCVFNGVLFAGTYNQVSGGQLWRTPDGVSWAPCASPFPWNANNQGIYSLSVFNNELYAGTANQVQGCELWKSGDGYGFAKVGENGFGDTNNKYIYSQATFNGNLYAGTYNLINGCEIWRSADGGTWTQSNISGFGKLANKAVWSFGVFSNSLYAGTWKEGGGAEVWRTPDGSSWVQVNSEGFGNNNNQLALSLCPFGNYLYCGSYNSAQGGSIYRYGPASDLLLPSVWYFAEGTTRNGFHTWLSLQNPQEIDSQVEITYMLSTSEYRIQKVTVPAMSRQTVDVNAFISGERDFSTKVVSSQPILAERPMYFLYQGLWSGGDCAMGAPSGRTSWYFAEGTTRPNFDEWICLENSGSAGTDAFLTYMLGTGQNINQTVPVPANSRVTVNVRAAVGNNQDVSTSITSLNPIIAERSTYFNYKGCWPGGDVAMGAPHPDTDWYFAEGTTLTGFETWLTIQNPGEEIATISMNFMRPGGAVIEKQVQVAAKSRYTYNVNDALGPNVDASTYIKSDKPIIAERPMYFAYHNADLGGHVVVGTNAPKQTWYFAEGTTRAGYEEWLCLQNPGEADVDVSISYLLNAGQPVLQVVKVPAHSRYTVSVNDAVGANKDVSAKVTAPSPIIVERPMYFNIPGGANGGSVVMGYGIAQ